MSERYAEAAAKNGGSGSKFIGLCDAADREKCSCGSGLRFEREYDAQGIYLCRVCPKCRTEKLSHYRPETLSGYNQSDVDEPI